MSVKNNRFLSREKLLFFAVWAMRLLVGGIFIVSGIAKSIDVYGFIYKIEEYLSVWGMSEPRSLIVIFAMSLSTMEFSLGLLLAVGAYKRTCVWIMLVMMGVMLPFTAYIWIADPVSDCGCFGDFVKISNGATFMKNLAITALLIFLAKYNRRVKGVYHAYTQWIVASSGAIYSIAIALYGFNIQPLVDFRSFPQGRNIVSEEVEEEEGFEYVYEKNGKKQIFSLDNLPDSTWTFVERNSLSEYNKEMTELNIYDESGENVTGEVLAGEGEQIIVVIPQQERADISSSYTINELQRFISRSDGSIIELIATDRDHIESWKDRSMAMLPIYIAEETMLKELSRGDMSVVYVKDGIIEWKRTLGSIDADEITSGRLPITAYATDGSRLFAILTVILISMMAIIYMLDAGRRFFIFRKAKTKQTAQQ